MSRSADWRFLVLPDHDGARDVAAALLPGAARSWSHASGRPWLLLRDADLPHVVVSAGANRVAAVGHSGLDPGAVAGRVAAMSSVADVDAVVRGVPGAFHAVASVDGEVRVQGTAYGVCRVFHARVGDASVVADRADVLADLLGVDLDLDALTLYLLDYVPAAAVERPLWPGVRVVAPDDYVVLDRTDGTEHRRWWSPPEPTLTRAEGAARLGTALADAVSARTAGARRVHCDLSGGMDSTSVCWFAAQGTTPVTAFTAYNEDLGGREDLTWARVALPALAGVEHVAESLDDKPGFLDGIFDPPTRLDDPSLAMLFGDRWRSGVADARGRGARVHLTGVAGDLLFTGCDTWWHGLIRTDPVEGWRHARTMRAMTGTGRRDLIRALADDRGLREWFADTHLPSATSRSHDMHCGWDHRSSRPAWLRPHGVELIEHQLRALVPQVRPLGPDRATHFDVSLLRDHARLVRGMAQAADAEGVTAESPLLDDAVADACLSVRRAERWTPREFKPLIKETMRGRLPESFLRRTTKNDGGAQGTRALVRHRRAILEVCADSYLGRAGIVDVDAVRSALDRAHDGPVGVNSTLQCALMSLAAPAALPGGPR